MTPTVSDAFSPAFYALDEREPFVVPTTDEEVRTMALEPRCCDEGCDCGDDCC